MSEQVVAKFGGTSMARPELVAGITEARPHQRIIVVSAPGGDESFPGRMTGMLEHYVSLLEPLEVGKDSPQTISARDEIVDRFDSVYSMLGERDRAQLRDRTATLLQPFKTNGRYYESLGERLSAVYFSRLVGARVLEPAIEFGPNDKVDYAKTKEGIQRQVHPGKDRLIVPGYYGWNANHQVRLLDHGGSDRTGALYAGALNLDYENWTDVSGVFSADPRMIPTARPIAELTREEVREGAHGGSGVLQGDAILDLNGSSSVIYLKNTHKPDDPGSRIVPELTQPREACIVGVSGRDDLVQINIKDMGMADQENYVARALVGFGLHGLSLENLPASQDSFSITVHRNKDNADAIEKFAEWVQLNHVGPNGKVLVRPAGVIHVVGEGLRDDFARQMATIRILGDAATHNMTAMPLPNTDVPSIAFMVEPDRMKELLSLIHGHEIEGKSRFSH